jgi:hypothetical protein
LLLALQTNSDKLVQHHFSGTPSRDRQMSELAITRSLRGDQPPNVLVEAEGRVLADVETLSARHAELVRCDLAMLALRTRPHTAVVFQPPLDAALCRPAWGRKRRLLAINDRRP